MSPIQSFYN